MESDLIPRLLDFIDSLRTRMKIAEYKNYSWCRFGALKMGQSFHGSISLRDEIIVIGGQSDKFIVIN